MKDKRYPFSKMSPDNSSEGEMNDVYAGPEYYERPGIPESEPEDAPLPPDEVKEEPIPPIPEIQCVYAGPEFFDKEPEPIMLLYAGPEYFRDKKPTLLFPDEDPKPVDSGFICPGCGKPAAQNDRFCSNCGMPLQKPDDNV